MKVKVNSTIYKKIKIIKINYIDITAKMILNAFKLFESQNMILKYKKNGKIISLLDNDINEDTITHLINKGIDFFAHEKNEKIKKCSLKDVRNKKTNYYIMVSSSKKKIKIVINTEIYSLEQFVRKEKSEYVIKPINKKNIILLVAFGIIFILHLIVTNYHENFYKKFYKKNYGIEFIEPKEHENIYGNIDSKIIVNRLSFDEKQIQNLKFKDYFLEADYDNIHEIIELEYNDVFEQEKISAMLKLAELDNYYYVYLTSSEVKSLLIMDVKRNCVYEFLKK